MAPILWALCSKEKSGANTNRLLICRSILFELNSVLYNSFLVLGCHSNQNRVHLYPELLALANKSLYCTLSCLWWHQVGRLNWFWWKYLHHKIWQALQRRTFFSFLESQLLKKTLSIFSISYPGGHISLATTVYKEKQTTRLWDKRSTCSVSPHTHPESLLCLFHGRLDHSYLWSVCLIGHCDERKSP